MHILEGTCETIEFKTKGQKASSIVVKTRPIYMARIQH